eukprot:CAMPEP_0170195868 /NCGR_PEP_ID=MMETSP0040_2-20121228/62455_1 /TAXON_ID=641309 /ORGANISM="Lotharella oceanica, Strain CCMP622" /LENGTH=80 /DNA_ID=CAMNT_0010445143 /DNA_START=255 /DNA_END=494 /DNA_ORIENTATION=-
MPLTSTTASIRVFPCNVSTARLADPSSLKRTYPSPVGLPLSMTKWMGLLVSAKDKEQQNSIKSPTVAAEGTPVILTYKSD